MPHFCIWDRKTGGRGSAGLLLCFGIAMIIGGMLYVVAPWRRMTFANLIGLVVVAAGVSICDMCIRVLRGPVKYTDEEVLRSKEDLDRMYLKEHGPRKIFTTQRRIDDPAGDRERLEIQALIYMLIAVILMAFTITYLFVFP